MPSPAHLSCPGLNLHTCALPICLVDSPSIDQWACGVASTPTGRLTGCHEPTLSHRSSSRPQACGCSVKSRRPAAMRCSGRQRQPASLSMRASLSGAARAPVAPWRTLRRAPHTHLPRRQTTPRASVATVASAVCAPAAYRRHGFRAGQAARGGADASDGVAIRSILRSNGRTSNARSRWLRASSSW